MMIQLIALFVDAYRELHARKLFWITMGLNLLVVLLFASLGISDRGVTVLHWEFDSPFVNTSIISPEVFYKLQFVTWGIPVWLSWVATILALVSAAGMIPDLVTAGSIETLLSKPIGRVRLLLIKYLTGLLFAAAQVLVFSLGCFLVIWIRGGSAEPSLFLAVPIVVLLFSYLFSVCALMGLLTRSAIAALLLTMLFWFGLFIVNTGDEALISQREGWAVRLEDAREQIDHQTAFADKRIAQLEAQGNPITDAEGEPIEDLDARRRAANAALPMAERRLARAEEGLETWSTWAGRVVLVKTVLPKTDETVGLLGRWMLSMEDIMAMSGGGAGPPEEDEAPALADPRAAERAEQVRRSRTLGWVLGTSLAFEALILAICCFVFARRDF